MRRTKLTGYRKFRQCVVRLFQTVRIRGVFLLDNFAIEASSFLKGRTQELPNTLDFMPPEGAFYYHEKNINQCYRSRRVTSSCC